MKLYVFLSCIVAGFTLYAILSTFEVKKETRRHTVYKKNAWDTMDGEGYQFKSSDVINRKVNI